uniref:Uncharacterized protein n=1 Tax=viral metagenome TaxID=1070528 RepID=A0A6C0H847_9ZZZZ
MSLRNCAFVESLKEKSREFLWCQIVETTEACTSKTYCNCGVINENLGCQEIFTVLSVV